MRDKPGFINILAAALYPQAQGPVSRKYVLKKITLFNGGGGGGNGIYFQAIVRLLKPLREHG